MKTNKKGISLIVLVITIIVMIILAGAVILSLDNAGIIDRTEEAVEKTNLKQVQYLATLKWTDAFLDGKTTQEELEGAVIKGLEEEGIKLELYGITVTEKGAEVFLAKDIDWVVATVDGVPIPRGFVASGATGENTKNGGLVIYEGTEAVTDENVETAKRTRNQYVWVPVPKDEFITKFVRQNFGSENVTAGAISNTPGTSGRWEVALNTATNMPLSTLAEQNAEYVSAHTLIEVQAMYASVKEYGGFYIARYEAGIGTQRTSNTALVKGSNVYSMMGKIPYTYISWGNSMADDSAGAVEVARSIYPNYCTNMTGVISTLTYGVQWDRTLAWWLEVGAKDGKGNTITRVDGTASKSYGNYSDHIISSGDLNDGAQYAVYGSSLGSYQEATSTSTKEDGTKWALSTGALKVSSVNNIYDMAGNMHEWTMSGSSTSYRSTRGSNFGQQGSYYPVYNGGSYSPNSTDYNRGFRTSLYIKLQSN